MTNTGCRRFINDGYAARRLTIAAEALEARRFLSTASLPAADAIPFKDVPIDTNPGTTPVVKLLVDIDNNGKEDAVIGHEANLGGGGLDIYQFPTSGNPGDHWNEISIDPKADVYESIRAADVSGNHDSHGNPVNDLVVNERGAVYWYENPLGLGENPYTSTWTKHLIGYASQGATHEMYIANLTGVANQIDVIDNTTIFFENSPTSWTQIATANYNRTEKGLYLFDSGSGLGAIDLLGTGDAPNYQVGWYENPRDYGGNAETGQWIFHAIGPKYGNYVGGDGVSYAAMDVNGDGREDIITSDGENGQNPPYLTGGLIWWQAPANELTGTWTEHVIDSTITDVHNLVLADLSNDGQQEILAFEQDQSPQGRLLILFNEGGTGQNWLEQTLASDSDQVIGGGDGGHNESVGDATGDGYLDILTSPHGYYTRINPITLFVNEIPSEGIVAPLITTSPVSQTINANGSVTFSVSASGTGPLTYQWEVNGLDIAGATSSSYTISSAPSGDNGNVYRCIVGNPAGLIPSSGATLTIANAVQAKGSLVGAQATAAASYNLTALGTSDWAHWGTGGSASAFEHDVSGGGQISNVAQLGTGTFGGWTNASRTVSWTNGSPIAADSSDDGYIYANTVIGSGYSFTVPASTTPETLYVFAAGNNTGAQLSATLSDSSAQPYVASASSSGTFSDLYTITFSASSAGQTLTVSYVKSSNINGSNGAIDLVAAALSTTLVGDTTPPTAAVTSAPALTAASNSPYTFTVTYSDNVAVNASSLGDGNLVVTANGYSQAASLVSTGLQNGSTVVATYSIPAPPGGWTSGSDGTYNIALNANQVSDTSGNFAAAVAKLGTFSVSIPVATTGGSLAGSQASAAAGYNLTTLGTSDWAHWGAGGVYGAFDDDASGGGQISNITQLGSGAQFGAYSDSSRAVSWTNGTPVASDSGDDGYIWANTVLGAGFSFTVPAGTSPQTLYVYAGGYSSGATLTATLSDSSASPYVASASGTGHYAELFAITFSAASAGQSLTISYVKSSVVNGDTGGSVDLIAAALSGATVADTTPPQAALQSTATITAATQPVMLNVNYTDNVAVSVGTLATGNLTISGPTSQSAAFVSASPSASVAAVTGTYTIAPPPGGWISADNGTYTVSLAANSVSDTHLNFAAGEVLGTFTIAIPNGTVGSGSITGSKTTATSSYNLTTLGTSDWAHWGLHGIYGNFDHDAAGGSQISNVTVVGAGTVSGGALYGRSSSWTNGSPLATDVGDWGYYSASGAAGAGFSFTAPADTTTRTLYVYAGGNASTVSLTATLSDGSAIPVVLTSSGTGEFGNLFKITYAAASANQTLTIDYVNTGSTGSADLMSAALQVD